MRNQDVIMRWYKKLRGIYGAPQGQWTLWCRRPKTDSEREQVMMEAILTQRTNWRNVELAIAALRKARLLSLSVFARAYRKDPVRTALLIKSSGFYQQKAERLCGLAEYVQIRYGGIAAMKKALPARLRDELLLLNGIGPETADSILLYALDKSIFVVDEYTRRFLFKIKKMCNTFQPSQEIVTDSYNNIQKLFEKNLKKDPWLYQDFHALIVIDGKERNSA